MGRRLNRRLAAAAGVLAALAAWDGARLWQAETLNRAIASGTVVSSAPDDVPEAQFAVAAQRAAAGDAEAAIARYQALADRAPGLAPAARYDAANLILRQALAERAAGNDLKALPLAELAKETYRKVLRAEPGHWDARYNLERALAIAPEAEVPDAEAAPPPARERAPTTMRSFTLGLP